MRSRVGFVLALAVGLGLPGCGTGAAEPPGSSVLEESPERRPTHASVSEAADDGLLFYAGGRIHDGDVRVRYPAEGTMVTYLARTASGWVTRERWPHVNGRSVLLDRDGSVLASYPFQGVGPRRFDVSADGSRVAFVVESGRRVDLVDAGSGAVVRVVRTGLRRLQTVHFSGDDLVISAASDRTVRWDARSATGTDLPYERAGRSSRVIDVSADGGRALVDDTVRVGARPCLSVYPVDEQAERVSGGCGVAAYEGALSPDGSRLVVVDGVRDDGTYPNLEGIGPGPRTFEVVDADSGEQVTSLDPPRRLVDVTWTAEQTVLVKTTNRTWTSFGIHECDLTGDCRLVARAQRLPALGRIG